MRHHRSLAAIQPALMLLLLFAASSCIRNRDYIYLQSPAEKAYWDLSPFQSKSLRRAPQAMKAQDSSVFVPYKEPEEYLIQFNDILRVDIKSFDEKANQLFNVFSAQNMLMGGAGSNQGGGDPYFMFGYTVSDSGHLDLPVLGKIKVAGMNVVQAQDAVQKEIDKYFTQAFVKLALGGIRFSVMGEVLRPGKYAVMQNRLTILEALATAGELKPEANRNRVQLIRQYPGGSRVVTLDLTDRRLLSSPYYFVRPNDVLYVAPLRVRELGTGLTAQQSMGTILTAISLLVNSILLYNTLRNL
ncbi:MAG: polysaccharide biosynthesis/export family protein, partial [Bacteroidota bacterium]